jgi:hypothetical protein
VGASSPNLGACRKAGRLAEPVEQLVAEWVVRQLGGPALTAALAAATREDQTERELPPAFQVDQDRLDELVDAFADGTLSQADFARARARMEARLDTTRQRARQPCGRWPPCRWGSGRCGRPGRPGG